jgi:hypothetical protein
MHRFLPFDSITLLDQDADAVRAAAGALRTHAQTTLRPWHHPIRDLVTGRCELEPGQAFVYSIGLYDYLSTDNATVLTQRLWTAVAPGGVLAIGNFAAGEHSNKDILLEHILTEAKRMGFTRHVRGTGGSRDCPAVWRRRRR